VRLIRQLFLSVFSYFSPIFTHCNTTK